MSFTDASAIIGLIYVLVFGLLYVTYEHWARFLRTGPPKPAAIRPSASTVPPGYVQRTAPPRPPKLLPPPSLNLITDQDRKAYCARLASCVRIVSYISRSGARAFPLGLLKEWHAARWKGDPENAGLDSAGAVSWYARFVPEDQSAYRTVVESLMGASYDELHDFVNFCSQAFPLVSSDGPARGLIEEVADILAVTMPSGIDPIDEAGEEDTMLLERKLEVDFMHDIPAKVHQLRRMHALFRKRFAELRDDPRAERREARMSDCRMRMEEHESLLARLGANVSQ